MSEMGIPKTYEPGQNLELGVLKLLMLNFTLEKVYIHFCWIKNVGPFISDIYIGNLTLTTDPVQNVGPFKH